MGSFPNTYTFTKRLAEQVVNDYVGTIPAVIFRPSIGEIKINKSLLNFN